MHYLDRDGKHCEIDEGRPGEYILAGREPRLLSPLEVAKEYTPADERRRHQRRAKGAHANPGRRRRDRISQAEDVTLALDRGKANDAESLRARISGETRVQDEAA